MAHRAPGGRPGLCTAHPCWGHERKGGEQPCSGPPGPRWPTLLMAAMHGGGMQTPGGGAPPNKHRSSARPLWTRSLPHWSPRGQERTDTWSVGGECPSVRSPTNASDFYSFFLCFFLLFHPTSIFFCGGCHLVVKKKSHPVLVFCRHRHQGRNEADTNMRQAGRGRAAGLQTPSLSREASRSSARDEGEGQLSALCQGPRRRGKAGMGCCLPIVRGSSAPTPPAQGKGLRQHPPSLQRGHGRARAVEMHVLPLAIAAVPHARLLGLAGAGPALPVDVLRQADVGDARCVLPDDVHVRVQDGRVDGLAVLGEHCGQGQRRGLTGRPEEPWESTGRGRGREAAWRSESPVLLSGAHSLRPARAPHSRFSK